MVSASSAPTIPAPTTAAQPLRRAPATPRHPLLADLALVALVLLIYASVFLIPYAFLDDYAILAGALQHDPMVHDLNISMGRPIASFVMDNSFRLAGSVEALRWLRLASVVGFALFAVIIRRLASRAGWDRWSATSLALLFVTLPNAQVYISWTTLWFYPYLACLVAAAIFLLDSRPFSPSVSPISPTKLRRAASVTIALLLLITVGLSYQPMMFLFVPLFMLRHWAMPHSPGQVSFRVLLLHASVLAAATIVCFCIFKFGSKPSFRGAFPVSWLAKVEWFIRQPLVNSLNLIYIDVNNHPAVECVALLTATITFLGILRTFARTSPRFAARALFLPTAIVASYIPSLVVDESWPTFRSTYCLYCMSLVAVFWGLHQFLPILRLPRVPLWPILSRSFAALACVLALVQCYTLFARPQHDEYLILTQKVAQLPLKAGDRIYFQQPEKFETPAWIQLFEEFGTPSTSVSWTPRDMVWLILRQTHPALPHDKYTIPLTLSSDAAPAPPATNPAPDYVIDMKTALTSKPH